VAPNAASERPLRLRAEDQVVELPGPERGTLVDDLVARPDLAQHPGAVQQCHRQGDGVGGEERHALRQLVCRSRCDQRPEQGGRPAVLEHDLRMSIRRLEHEPVAVATKVGEP
jgi:hypothetical protein